METILALPAVERYTRQAATDAMAVFVDPGDHVAGRKTKPDVSVAADKQPSFSVLPPRKPSLACRDKWHRARGLGSHHSHLQECPSPAAGE